MAQILRTTNILQKQAKTSTISNLFFLNRRKHIQNL